MIRLSDYIKPKEADILRDILECLAYVPGRWWRNNTGAFAGEYKGKKRFVRYGDNGSADIFGVLKPTGRFVAIEVKRPGKKQRPDQIQFEKEVKEAGGIYILAFCVDDVLCGLQGVR